MNLFERWQQSLNELRAAGRYRSLCLPCGVDFSSNDYLGYGKASLARRASEERPSLTRRVSETARSGTASRLLRGQHPIWEEVEAALAAWHNAEAALMFTSGYCANEGLLSAVIEPGDFLASDQLNHASLIDGARLSGAERFIFRHNDLNHLDSGLRAAAEKRRPGRQLFVVTEALFGMEGDRAPLGGIADLCERYQAHLIVDEAHTTGCLGPRGSGYVDELELRRRVLATVHTGGKALGVAGAYVCGSGLLKEILVNRCRHLIFTTALPPAIGGWWLDMLPKVQADDAGRRRLHANAAAFRAALAKSGCPLRGVDYIVPVVLGDDRRAAEAAQCLQEQDFDIRAIRPPTVPRGTARLRISIHADHDAETLRAAAAAVQRAAFPSE